MSSLSSEYAVDQALLDENKKIVALRFDVSANFKSQSIDFEFAKKISKLKKYFTIFSIDTKQVSNFNLMYELFESSAYFLFFKNKKIMIDQGTGNNNKLETNSLIQAKLLKILEIAIKNIKKGKNFFFYNNLNIKKETGIYLRVFYMPVIPERKFKGLIFFTKRKKSLDVFFFLKILIKKFTLFTLDFNGSKIFFYILGFFLQNFRILIKTNGTFMKILKNEPEIISNGKRKNHTQYRHRFNILKKKFLSFLKKAERLKKTHNVLWEVFKVYKYNLVLKDSIVPEKSFLFFRFFKENLKNFKPLRYNRGKGRKDSLRIKNSLFGIVKKGKIFPKFSEKKFPKKKKVHKLKKNQHFRKKFTENTFFVHRISSVENKCYIILNEKWNSEKTFLKCAKNWSISISWDLVDNIGQFLLGFSQEKYMENFGKFSVFSIKPDFKKKLIQINGTKYEKLELIGKGGTGKVYKIIDQKRNVFALKKIKIRSFGTENLHSCINEISILKILRHHYRVVQLKNADISLKNDLIYMVFEYGECDLNRLLKQNPISLSKDSFLKFLWRQILETVQAIHQERIVHGDLKPANFLIIEGSLKIIDFGIAKPIQNDTTNITRTSQIGTLNYMPPESVLDIPSFCERKKKFRLSRSADVWSLGCILFQMVYGKTPFYHLTMMKKIQAIVNKSFEISFLPTKTPLVTDVLKNCLQRNPDSRPSIPELLKHPFLVSENLRISIKKTTRDNLSP